MGQQQLLLLVLGIVIVGLAVVVGIQAFGENQQKSNQDAMINDGVRIASDAQAWALKPTAFGGGNGDWHAGDATTGDLVDFTDLGYDVTGANYINVNGTFTLAADGTGILISGVNEPADNAVFVQVCGFDSDDITTEIGATASASSGLTACA